MIEIKEKIELAPYTSWQVGGAAEFFCLPTQIEQIKEAQKWAQDRQYPITILAGGSNVLISDAGIAGLTICLKNFSGTEISESNNQLEIIALAGTSKSELLKIYLKYKLAPALFLAGLPGDVGGGIVMNAGVAEAFKPREFVELTEWVEVLRSEGSNERLSAKDLNWSYRHCQGWEPGIIVRAKFVWPLHVDATILDQVRQANKVRLSKQPLDMPSCGSVFINPPGHKSAQLIDSCGLKGFSIGGAEVSLKHANFIVNTGGATASEIWQVIEHVRRKVLDQTGVGLKTEVIRLGQW